MSESYTIMLANPRLSTSSPLPSLNMTLPLEAFIRSEKSGPLIPPGMPTLCRYYEYPKSCSGLSPFSSNIEKYTEANFENEPTGIVIPTT